MQDNLIIEKKTINGIDCIHFNFTGRFTEENAINSIVKWKEMLENQNTKIAHVWNCLQMKGYEPMARISWQKAIKELKDKIGTIWLITESSIILAGASIISLFTSMNIRTVKTEDNIKN